MNKPQAELLAKMVDASRATEDRPEAFMVPMTSGDDQALMHPGFDGEVRVYVANLRALERAGFIEISERHAGTLTIEVTHAGFAYVDEVAAEFNGRNAASRQVPPARLISTSLYVLPDDAVRARATELLNDLDRAIRALEEDGLNDAQQTIVNDTVLPSLSELRALFAGQAETVEQAAQQRRRALSGLSSVMGWARNLVTISTLAEQAQKLSPAAERVVHTTQALQPVWEALVDWLTSPPL